MKPEELEERLADAENVLALHGKRIANMEEREPKLEGRDKQPEIKIPDYTRHFEELKTMVRQHSLAYSSLQIYAQITSFQKTISELPKFIPVTHHHFFTDRSKGLLVGGIGLILVAAITVGLSFGLYQENNRLRENDIKYRMIRQSIPEAANWADTTYHLNPTWAEKVVKKQEAEL